MARRRLQCLIVEKQDWETGAHQHQLQIPIADAREFFGPGNRTQNIQLNVFLPGNEQIPRDVQEVSVSRVYANATRRINRFHSIGLMHSCFMFFQQTAEPTVFDFWFDTDKAIVATRYSDWHQGRNSQHGRGRLVTVVDAPVPKWFDRID